MKIHPIHTIYLLFLMLSLSQGAMAGQTIPMQLADSNPCAMKGHNPCNPCAVKKDKNPCAVNKDSNPCNPCSAKHRANPCAAKNPCNPCAAKNPCGNTQDAIDPNKVSRPAGVKLYAAEPRQKLVQYGRKLFKDTSLSSNGLSCNDCHATNDLFNAGFAKPYPHPVSMAKQRAGLGRDLGADEFVQFCMLAPMESRALPWKSRELAALAAYVQDIKQPEFRQWVSNNPCALKKTRSMKSMNPCARDKNAVNPCNPCGVKQATKNPCNPSAGKQP